MNAKSVDLHNFTYNSVQKITDLTKNTCINLNKQRFF